MRRNGPQRKARPSEGRWSLEQRQRLERAMRAYYARQPSYKAMAAALGVSETGLKRTFGGVPISVELAEAVARAFGTTADDIALGRWTPGGKAA